MKLQHIYLALRKRALLGVRGRYFVVRRRRIKFLVDILNYIDRNIEAYGGYENSLVEQLIADAKSMNGDIFIDIGANIGLYSLNAALHFPEMEVHAFEPDQRNLAHLHANLFLNNLQDRVKVHPVALSDHEGEVRFHRHSADNPGRSSVSADGNLRVAVTRLDNLVAVRDRKIVIKIDVEGHELAVLKGMSRLLSENNCHVQVEAFDPNPVHQHFAEHGYQLIRQHGADYIFVRKVQSVADSGAGSS